MQANDGKSIVDDLANTAFSKAEDDPVSVYEVFTGPEEVVAIAAVEAGGNGEPGEVVGIRILWEDLARAGVTWRREPGQTGVTKLDPRHVDLLAGPAQYRLLVELLLEKQCRGEDGIRSVRRSHIARQWQALLDGEIGEISEELKTRLAKRIERMKRK